MSYKHLVNVLQSTTVVADLNALEVAGIAVVALLGLRIIAAIVAFIVSALAPRKAIKAYGEWAVVTGATDGIGKAYAEELGRQGLNLVLISRSEEKLKATAEELSGVTKRKVETIAFDFSVNADHPNYEKLAAKLSNYNIGVLVNNVGTSYPSALYFDELEKYSPGLTRDMINLNVVSTTKMTQIVLPGMLARKSGAIINIASAAGRIPIGNPLYAEYSGSKAYVDYFSRSLHYEYAGKGIHVQCQSPYYVTSKMSKIRKASLLVPDPASFAKAAVAAIGTGASVVPATSHAIIDWVIRSMPTWMLSRYLMSTHLNLRYIYQRKHAAANATDKQQ